MCNLVKSHTHTPHTTHTQRHIDTQRLIQTQIHINTHTVICRYIYTDRQTCTHAG